MVEMAWHLPEIEGRGIKRVATIFLEPRAGKARLIAGAFAVEMLQTAASRRASSRKMRRQIPSRL